MCLTTANPGTGSLVRLREKGGRRKQIACHHLLEEYLCAYIDAAAIADEPDTPLFRTVKGKTKQLTENRIDQSAAWRMLQRHHQLPGERRRPRDGTVHSRPRTAKLYDRLRQMITRSEVERIHMSERLADHTRMRLGRGNRSGLRFGGEQQALLDGAKGQVDNRFAVIVCG